MTREYCNNYLPVPFSCSWWVGQASSFMSAVSSQQHQPLLPVSFVVAVGFDFVFALLALPLACLLAPGFA